LFSVQLFLQSCPFPSCTHFQVPPPPCISTIPSPLPCPSPTRCVFSPSPSEKLLPPWVLGPPKELPELAPPFPQALGPTFWWHALTSPTWITQFSDISTSRDYPSNSTRILLRPKLTSLVQDLLHPRTYFSSYAPFLLNDRGEQPEVFQKHFFNPSFLLDS